MGDTIYLFTDIVRTDAFNEWNQVGLHQFKSYGDINKWYHDTTDIHLASDFTWTDGNYLSQLLGVTPLMDGNRLRLWYWGYDLAQINPTDITDTSYNVHLVGTDLHPDVGHWGIGTSEYVFPDLTDIKNPTIAKSDISIHYYKNKGFIETESQIPSTMKVYSISGQLLFEKTFTKSLHFNIDYNGLVLINVTNKNSVLTKKYYSF